MFIQYILKKKKEKNLQGKARHAAHNKNWSKALDSILNPNILPSLLSLLRSLPLPHSSPVFLHLPQRAAAKREPCRR